MLANILLWLFSILLALVVHAAGLLLFEPRQPNLPNPNAFSEEIVVMLGEGSGRTAESIKPLRQPDSVTRPESPSVSQVDPMTDIETGQKIEQPKVEAEISAPPENRYMEPEEARHTSVADTTTLMQEPTLPGIEAPAAGAAVPNLFAQEPEAADTVAREAPVFEQEPPLPRIETADSGAAAPGLSARAAEAPDTVASVTAPAEEVEQRLPVSVAAAQNHTELVAPRPSAAKISRPDSELTAVVAPAQLVDDASVADQPETVDIESSPVAVVEDAAGASAAAPEQVQVAGASEAVIETTPQSDDAGSQHVTAPEVQEEVADNRLAAVVLQFETVDAAEVNGVRELDPNSATLVSIEEQIARALTLDESQSSGLGMGVVARYAGLLKGRLENSMHYPRAARLAGQQGSVVVRFVIDRNGTVLSIVLEKPSGHAILDREAVEMIERAEPFPIMPGDMSGEVLELRVPVAYKIEEDSRTRDIPPIYLE